MKKLSVIGFMLALPTTVITFMWIVSIGMFNWIEGMQCGFALISNAAMVCMSVFVTIALDDKDVSYFVDSWKDHRQYG
tara:strand:+ start:285 stop:518 length:234 start_codon:yes stop_codon:yes gene_type:complete